MNNVSGQLTTFNRLGGRSAIAGADGGDQLRALWDIEYRLVLRYAVVAMKEVIIRNVQDIEDVDRRALEHVLGQKLRKNQQVFIRVVSLGPESSARDGVAADAAVSANLPEWCKVYDGLSDDEVADIENVVLQRANFTRV